MNFRARAFSVLLVTAAGLSLAACDSAEDRAAAHYESGMELLEEGNAAKAQLEFRNVIKLQPEHVEARYELASWLKGQNDIRGAVGQYRSILELKKDHVPARIDLAEIMLIADQTEEASRNIEVAFAVTPEDPRVRAIKSSVDYKRGEKMSAVDMASTVLEENPESVTARLVLVADAMDAGRNEDALALLDGGLETSPDELSLNVIRLGLLERTARTEEIGPQLERMVEAYPKTDQFREALARWYVFKKRYDDAEAQYRAISENNPADFQRALDVPRFLNAVHGPERAREELERLAAQPGALVEYDLSIAALDIQQGDEDAAIERLDRIIAEREKQSDADKARLERAKIHIRREEFAAADQLLAVVLGNDAKNEQALLLRASRHLAADENEQAIRDLRTALDVAPENVQIMLLLASAYERNGSRELALERLAQAVQKSDYEAQVVLRYTQALVEAQKVDVAESLLLDAMKRKSENRDLLVGLAQIKLRKQEWEAAENIAGRLKVLDPEDPVADRLEAAAALGQQRLDESVDILRGLIDNAGEGEGDSGVISLVRALLAGGDIDRAETFLDERLQANPDDAASLVLRASIRSSKGDLDTAERDLLKAIELQPDNAAAYASLARIYNSLGKETQVSEALEKGLALNDKDVSLRLTQAMQLEYEGRFDEAIEVYSELYKERPNSAIVANNFASLLADHRANRPDQLQRAFNIAKRFRNTDQPYLQDTYAWLLHLTGGSAEALPIMRRAAEGLPTNPLVQYHLGVVLAANGELAQARDRVNRALELAGQVKFPHEDRARQVLERIDALEAEQRKKAGQPALEAQPAGATQ